MTMSKNGNRYRTLTNPNTNAQLFLQTCLLASKFSLACFYALFDCQTRLGFNVSILCIAAAPVSLIRRSGWVVPLVVFAMLPVSQLQNRVTEEAISLVLIFITFAILLGVILDFFTFNGRGTDETIHDQAFLRTDRRTNDY